MSKRIVNHALAMLLRDACRDEALAEPAVAALLQCAGSRPLEPEGRVRWEPKLVAQLEAQLWTSGSKRHAPLLAFCIDHIHRFAPAVQRQLVGRALENKTLRAKAVELTIARKLPAAPQVAAAAIADRSTVVVRTTISALLAGQPSTVKPLLPDILRHARNRNRAVRVQVCRACALFPSAETAKLLRRFVADPEQSVRAAAVAGLVETKHPDASPTISLFLRDPSPWVRGEACRLAREHAVPAGVDEISALLHDLNGHVRLEAFQLLFSLNAAMALRLSSVLEPAERNRFLHDLGIAQHREPPMDEPPADAPPVTPPEETPRARAIDPLAHFSKEEILAQVFGAVFAPESQPAHERTNDDAGTVTAPDELDLLSVVTLGRLAAGGLHGIDAALSHAETVLRPLIARRGEIGRGRVVRRLKRLFPLIASRDEAKIRVSLKRILRCRHLPEEDIATVEAFGIGLYAPLRLPASDAAAAGGTVDDADWLDEPLPYLPIVDPRERALLEIPRSGPFQDAAFLRLAEHWLQRPDATPRVREKRPDVAVAFPLYPALHHWALLRASPVCLGFLLLEPMDDPQFRWPWLSIRSEDTLTAASREALARFGHTDSSMALLAAIRAAARASADPAAVERQLLRGALERDR